MNRYLKYSLVLLWLAAVSVAYCRLFPPSALVAGLPRFFLPRHPFSLFLSLLIPAAFLAAANGWGIFFWKSAGISRLEKTVFATGAGLGIIALTTAAADFFGAPSRTFSVIVLAAGIVLSAATVRDILPLRLPRNWLAFLAVPPLASALIGALAPPTQFDSLVYHLALPAQYLAHGGFGAGTGTFFFSFPQNLEMLFQTGLSVSGDITANLIAWSFLPLTALALYAFARRYISRAAASAAALIWLFTPSVLFLASGTYVDIGLAFFVLLGFHALILWDDTRSDAWLLAAALFTGLACGTKYTAAAFGVFFFIFTAVRSRKITPPAVFAAVSLVVFLPWLIKDTVYLKNPLAPWAAGLFPASAISPGTAGSYFLHINSHGMPVRSALDLLLLPWNLTAYGFRYGGAFDLPGPLFLLFIPALCLSGKIDRIKQYLLFVTAAYFLVWFGTGKVLRFLFPAMPFLALLAAIGFTALAASSRGIRRTALFFGALFLVHNLFLFHWVMKDVDPYPVAAGAESRDSYLTRKLNYYHGIASVNRLPAGARVLFFGETRRYYNTADALVPTVFDRNPVVLWANSARQPEDIASAMRSAGITHLFVNEYETARLGGLAQLSPPGRENWDRFRERCLTTVSEDRYCRLYELK